MALFVWQLKARLDNPFTEGIMEKQSTTVFATKELAESRFEVFRNLIRMSLKLEDDYEVCVETVPMEVIQN